MKKTYYLGLALLLSSQFGLSSTYYLPTSQINNSEIRDTSLLSPLSPRVLMAYEKYFENNKVGLVPQFVLQIKKRLSDSMRICSYSPVNALMEELNSNLQKDAELVLTFWEFYRSSHKEATLRFIRDKIFYYNEFWYGSIAENPIQGEAYLTLMVIKDIMNSPQDLLFESLTEEDIKNCRTTITEDTVKAVWDLIDRPQRLHLLCKEMTKQIIESSTLNPIHQNPKYSHYLEIYQDLFAWWPELEQGPNGRILKAAIDNALEEKLIHPIPTKQGVQQEQKSVTEAHNQLWKKTLLIDTSDEESISIDFSDEEDTQNETPTSATTDVNKD